MGAAEQMDRAASVPRYRWRLRIARPTCHPFEIRDRCSDQIREIAGVLFARVGFRIRPDQSRRLQIARRDRRACARTREAPQSIPRLATRPELSAIQTGQTPYCSPPTTLNAPLIDRGSKVGRRMRLKSQVVPLYLGTGRTRKGLGGRYFGIDTVCTASGRIIAARLARL